MFGAGGPRCERLVPGACGPSPQSDHRASRQRLLCMRPFMKSAATRVLSFLEIH